MADLLELSARIIDSGHADEAVNRVTQELSEVSDDLALIESFSHVVLLQTAGGLVAFDTSGAHTGAACVDSLRAWRPDDPISHLVYTHGHVDHVGGSGAFLADAEAQGHGRPEVLAHEAVPERFDRYRQTNGWNLAINMRQFGWIPRSINLGIGGLEQFLPDDVAEPDVTYRQALSLDAAGTPIELHHARGETDDHTWAWLPEQRAICAGDFLIWNFPNAGNPQKVQRYPEEWAAALRDMAAYEPELLLPAHGLPLAGQARIAMVLDEVATALEELVAAVLERMNAGARLDEIIHEVKVPEAVLARPFLRPFYDEPEFVVHNVWRRYGGWWDGDPATLKPAPAATLAAEVASLAGGALNLARRGEAVAADGDLRLACHLVELAGLAAPEEHAVQAIRAQVYEQRRLAETSLMAKGVYASAVRESQAVLGAG
ncbi:MAG TPA: alkyl sulfatase dimerization domain-containing protein [Acidimicrobiales bacterium]|nr:alkyl sulfatase dimerization domain-containing protein [Acidimicrobiales bacterium]